MSEGERSATDWNRTSDPRFTKALLYQLSYGGAKDGAEGQSCTGDTTIFSRVLYYLSYLGK